MKKLVDDTKLKELAPTFNLIRRKMMGTTFTRAELCSRMKAGGIIFRPQHCLVMERELNLLVKIGEGKNVKYSWKILMDNGTEYQPHPNTFVSIFKEAIKYRKICLANSKKTDDNEEFMKALELVKSRGIKCTQEFTDAAGQKFIREL